jgi:hypothetical protein
MTNNTPFISSEIEKSQALLCSSKEYKLLSFACGNTLKKHSVEVYFKPQSHTFYDYILLFGTIDNSNAIIKKIKNNGKILIVKKQSVSSSHTKEKFETYLIDVRKRHRTSTLVNAILKKLFASSPIPNAQVIQITSKSKFTKKTELRTKTQIAKKPLLFLFLTGIFLFLVPLCLLAFSASISFYYLQKAATYDVSDTEKVQRAFFISEKAQKVYTASATVYAPIISAVSPPLSKDLQTLSSLQTYANSFVTNGRQILKLIVPASSLSTPELFKNLSLNKNHIDENLLNIEQSLNQLIFHLQSLSLPVFSKSEKIHSLINSLIKTRSYIKNAESILPVLDVISGFDTEKTYLVLLQNNFELRPTGGFIGTYALLKIKEGIINQFSVYDVYEADGQLKGNVSPPQPIATYMNQPNWFLRDSNWDPDFLKSAKQAQWFLEKETGIQTDGVIGVDIEALKNILEAVGPLYVPDYNTKVSSDDFYLKLQSETEANFFPGSSKKSNLIESLANALFISLSQPSKSVLPLAEALLASLEQKHILFYFNDLTAQEAFEKNGWAGRIVSLPQDTQLNFLVSDYILTNEANLGVNKVNFYISREYVTSANLIKTQIHRIHSIYYSNKSPETKTVFSGTYKAYIRFFIPNNAKNVVLFDKSIPIDNSKFDVLPYDDKKSIGILFTVLPNEHASLSIEYDLDIQDPKKVDYRLVIQKQPGLPSESLVFKASAEPPWTITDSNTQSIPELTSLSADKYYSIDFLSVSR